MFTENIKNNIPLYIVRLPIGKTLENSIEIATLSLYSLAEKSLIAIGISHSAEPLGGFSTVIKI